MADKPFEPEGGWGSVRPKTQKRIQKRYTKAVNKARLKHALPIAAETAGIMRGIAKSAEVSLDEQGIRDTQRIANNADANLTNVLNSTQLGPFSRLRARAIVRKNTRSGMKEGTEVGKQIFKSPEEMRKVIRKDTGR